MKEDVEKSAEWLAAEKAFGCVFSSFKRLGMGNSSRNFRAEQPDGHAVLVKFANERRSNRLLPRLRAMSSPLIPSLAFGGATGRFGRYVVSAIEWCGRGSSIPPHMLTDGRLRAILAGYAQLSDVFAAVDATTLEGCPGLEEAARRCGLAPRPIHGDFHYCNYFLDGDAFTACFDFEFMRLGLPTEDLLRIFAHALERTRFWSVRRMDAICRNFGRLVRFSPYGEEAWLAAIDLHELAKTSSRAAKKCGIFSKIEAVLRSSLYRRLRRIVREAKANGQA